MSREQAHLARETRQEGEGFASFFKEKIEVIRKSFDFKNCLKVAVTYPNHLSKMSSFKAVSQDEIGRFIGKAKPTTCVLDTIPTKLLKAHQDVSCHW